MNIKSLLLSWLIVQYNQSAYFDIDSEIVLFLHWWWSSAWSFSYYTSLCDEKRISRIALELPGFSHTQRPKETWWVDNYAMFVYQLMIKLGITSCKIVGHSFWGQIAIPLCKKLEELNLIQCSNMILLAPAIVRNTTASWWKSIYYSSIQWCKKIFPQSIVQFFKQRIASSDYLYLSHMEDIFKKIITEDQSYLLDSLEANINIIWAKDDADVPITHMKLLEQKIKHGQMIIITWGHYDVLHSSAVNNLLIS